MKRRLSGVLLFVTVSTVAVASRGDDKLDSEAEVPVIVAINVAHEQCRRTEPLPLAVAVANASTGTVYVSTIERPFVEVKNAAGEVIDGAPIDEPLEPPADHYMNVDGKEVLMQPVWRLESRRGVVVVLPDAFERYHGHLSKGRYSLTLRARYITVHDEHRLVRRPGLAHECWVKAGGPTRRLPVSWNTVTVEVDR